jgi:hypothetical protein
MAPDQNAAQTITKRRPFSSEKGKLRELCKLAVDRFDQPFRGAEIALSQI